jgi:hypothetical protein
MPDTRGPTWWNITGSEMEQPLFHPDPLFLYIVWLAPDPEGRVSDQLCYSVTGYYILFCLTLYPEYHTFGDSLP